MKRVLAAAAAILTTIFTVSSPVAVSADTGLQDLFRREQTALGALPDQHLKTMLTAPRAKRGKGKAKPFAYSDAWLDAQPEPQGGDNWRCLSEALYFEARGETVKGQFAVAEVIMNRVKSARFPDTLCGVIHQGTGKNKKQSVKK